MKGRIQASFSAILVVALCANTLLRPGLAEVFVTPRFPFIPGSPIDLTKCWSSLFNVQGCNIEILKSALTGKFENVGPTCCEAFKEVDAKCWPEMFPLNPLFPTLLKDSCSRTQTLVLPGSDLTKCWSSLFNVQDCNIEILKSALTGKFENVTPTCCNAFKEVDAKCWPKMFPLNPLFPPLLRDSCSRISTQTLVLPVIPAIPGSPVDLTKCLSSLFNVEGCVTEIYKSVSTGKIDNVGPECCKAFSAVDAKCWPQMFPLKPFFPPLLKNECSRIILDPPTHNFRQGDPGNVIYHGDARADGTVQLTTPDYTARVGWITYAEKVPIWNPRTGEPTDFSTSFSFRIDTRNVKYQNFGHGFCFFLAPMGIQLLANSAGGFLGLFNRTDIATSLFPLVHVEFDSFNNAEWDPDPVSAGSHVGINNRSLISSNYTSWNASTHSQDICRAHISYDSVTKNLSVSWAYALTSDPQESLGVSYIIDLAKVLPPQVMIGFSASTGAVTEEHRLLSWEFSSDLDIEKASIIRRGLIVGILVSGFVFLTSLVIILVVWLQKQRKRKDKERIDLISINEDLNREAGPRRFPYKDLVSATNRFSAQRKLGEGGFGAVYRGYLNEIDMLVAVKKLSARSRQGKKEFVTEVKIISKLRHRNLVQLIGWCNEKDEYLLIYELMPNGSLDTHLFGKRPHLPWDIRYKIALGLASALLYLHEEWDRCVLHRDIKASKIMLDTNYNVKLGDFGLARLMDHELGSHTTGLAGTFGYMAPEYVMTGRASKESDIYSFGISVLEIVTGRKSVEHSQENTETQKSLVERVWDLYGRQQLMSAMDEKLGEDFNREQAECLVVVGLWCGHPDRNSRPSIRQAIQVLNLESPLPNLPQKMPVPMYCFSPSSLSVSSSRASITFSSCQVGR